MIRCYSFFTMTICEMSTGIKSWKKRKEQLKINRLSIWDCLFKNFGVFCSCIISFLRSRKDAFSAAKIDNILQRAGSSNVHGNVFCADMEIVCRGWKYTEKIHPLAGSADWMGNCCFLLLWPLSRLVDNLIISWKDILWQMVTGSSALDPPMWHQFALTVLTVLFLLCIM